MNLLKNGNALKNNLYFKIKHKCDVLNYSLKTLTICLFRITKFLNRYLFRTYPLIEDCGRCEDCGRNVHDFRVPDDLWKEVYGDESGILCYDCFCNRGDEKFRFKWRMGLREEWKRL